jgi:serine/threonine protein kinase
MSDDGGRRPRSNSRSSNTPSIPSIQTAHFGAAATPPPVTNSDVASSTVPAEIGIDSDNDVRGEISVSTDQERQILILMLLAQVCALHDATPRTFTVHVLELFERGILDRESIHFLFELGLVPSSTSSVLPSTGGGLLMNGEAEAVETEQLYNDTTYPVSTEALEHIADANFDADTIVTGGDDGYAEGDAVVTMMTTELAIATKSSVRRTTATQQEQQQQLPRHTNAIQVQQTVRSLRSIEATAIRRQLSIHDVPPEYPKRPSRVGENQTAPDGPSSPNGDTINNIHTETSPRNNYTHKPWDVEHFPLSLSRYQREFKQICMLNAGAFGQVFHAIRELDGCEYAIKKVSFDAMGYSNHSIQRVIREVQCLATVNDHPNIVRYYTSWLEPSWMTGSSSSTAVPEPTRRRLQIGGNLNNNNHSKSNNRNTHNDDPRQRLLNNLRNRLLNPPGMAKTKVSDDDDSDSSCSNSLFGKQESQSFMSDESTSTFDIFHSRGRQQRHLHQPTQHGRQRLRRRRSLDSSVASIEESSSWQSYHSHSLQPWGNAYDDSYVRDTTRDGTTRSSSSTTIPPPNAGGAAQSTSRATTSSYRYQINLYIQMQLCHPATLSDWIRERNRRISEADHGQRIGPALEIFQQIVNGLAHIHSQNIIHRDLKPANIFASADGAVIKIGDFGLSKQLQDITTQQSSPRKSHTTTVHVNSSCSTSPSNTDCTTTVRGTEQTAGFVASATADVPLSHQDYWHDPNNGAVVARTGSVPTQALVGYNHRIPTLNEPLTAGIGTASYAAPEQVRTRDYGPAVDVFSLGLILLELVCSFDTEHERLDHFQKCRNQTIPQWIHEHYPDVSSTILACTRPKGCDRPTSADLADFAKVTSPRSLVEVHLLKGQLREKEQELAEKDKMIKEMQKEMARMKASMNTSTECGTSPGSPI